MPAQPSSSRPTPLNQRSQSQNNSLAIRVVPYSPPRIASDSRTPSQSSAQPHATGSSPASRDGQPSYVDDGLSLTGEDRKGRERLTSGRGLGLSSASFLSLRSVESEDGRVSVSPDDDDPRRPLSPVVSPSEACHGVPDQAFRREASLTTHPRPRSRSRNTITIHADKTFSLNRHGPQSDSSRSFMSPPLSYSSRTSSWNDRPSLGTWSDGRASSPWTSISPTIPDYSLSPCAESPVSSTSKAAKDLVSSSPWNYRMVGGLRKVPETPGPGRDPPYSPDDSDSSHSLSPEISSSDFKDEVSRSVVLKPSSVSAQTASTTSETTNYKVYGRSPAQLSCDSFAPPSSSHSNYEIIGVSSPAAPFRSSPPDTSDSEENFVLHGFPSPSPSVVAVTGKPRPTYSQESLIVAPLRPTKKTSHERLGYYKQRSSESLRTRAGSIKTIRSIKSISSVISQEAAHAFLSAPFLFNLQEASPSHPMQGDSGIQQQTHDSWEAFQAAAGSAAGLSFPSSIAPPHRAQMLQSHPRQWSAQLSTVMSESEVGSSPGHSRSVSRTSIGNGAGHRRHSSAGWVSSMQSGQLQSRSSSMAVPFEENPGRSRSESRNDSVEKPRPVHSRSGHSAVRMVRDQDEHGDGLADLYDMSQRPSRSGHSGIASSDNSGRNLHSSTSSRANSFNLSMIPAWARVYYGSGERRFFGAPSISTSDAGDSRPGSSALYNSVPPVTDRLPLSVYGSRQRPTQQAPAPESRLISSSEDPADFVAVPLPADYGIFRTIKRKTSSIWSPHLRADRRASQYSVWDPPRVSWSADNGPLGRRNIQVVLFILGFIFPFAWMLAALLPLPHKPNEQMLEAGQIPDRFGTVDYSHQFRLIYETKYESARWWRNVNRIMALVGLLIIGVIIALAVVGVRQGWASQ